MSRLVRTIWLREGDDGIAVSSWNANRTCAIW
jgi:hypothetical protein